LGRQSYFEPRINNNFQNKEEGRGGVVLASYNMLKNKFLNLKKEIN
jgi:hypothetical protein